MESKKIKLEAGDVSKMKRFEKIKKTILNNGYLFKICFKSDYKFLVLYTIDSTRNIVNYFFEYVFGLKFILECVEFRRPVYYPFIYLTLLFLFVSIGMVYSAWFNECCKLMKMPEIKYKLKKILYDKAKEVDIECYDNPEYYNDFLFVVSQSDKQCERMLDLVAKIFSCIVAVLLIGGYYFVNDIVSLVFIMLFFLVSTVINKKISKLKFGLKLEKNYNERRRDYIKRIFYLGDYAKEMRLHKKLSSKILDDFKYINEELLCIEKKYVPMFTKLSFLLWFVCGFLIRNVLYISYLLYKCLVVKTISISNFIVLFKSSLQAKKSMDEIALIYPEACEISMYVDKMILLIDMESKVKNEGNICPNSDAKILELKHVCYAYPGQEKFILQDINMLIELPSKIAIVGMNGAGKTTLIRLIMRMSDVSEGEILLDGINIKKYDLVEYRKFIGIIFQDFNMYAANLLENVVLDSSTDVVKDSVLYALIRSGFEKKYQELPNGLTTEITKEFYEDGINLSGGEEQQVALARVIYKGSYLLILDEPSSSLDPIAEYRLNETTMNISKSKQIIFISHRLSTTRNADCIYVLREGKIEECGSHTELMKRNGLYMSMWREQASPYQ